MAKDKDKDKTPFEPENYEQLYFHFFNRVTDAVYYIQGVQAEMEEQYIRMREKEDNRPPGKLLEWPGKATRPILVTQEDRKEEEKDEKDPE